MVESRDGGGEVFQADLVSVVESHVQSYLTLATVAERVVGCPIAFSRGRQWALLPPHSPHPSTGLRGGKATGWGMVFGVAATHVD